MKHTKTIALFYLTIAMNGCSPAVDNPKNKPAPKDYEVSTIVIYHGKIGTIKLVDLSRPPDGLVDVIYREEFTGIETKGWLARFVAGEYAQKFSGNQKQNAATIMNAEARMYWSTILRNANLAAYSWAASNYKGQKTGNNR